MASKSKDVNQIIKSVYIIKQPSLFVRKNQKIFKKIKNVVIVDYQAVIS